jgi:hypothetical protein
MTPSDQNDILHAVDSQAKIFSKRKPEIDMPDCLGQQYPHVELGKEEMTLLLASQSM